MSDRLVRAFDSLVKHMDDPPEWEELGMTHLTTGHTRGPRSMAFVGGLGALVVVGLVVVALVGDEETTSSYGPGCFAPPQSESDAVSPVAMEISPHPALANTEVMLTVSDPRPGEGSNNGLDVRWQCWDGTAWVDTHQLIRGWEGSRPQTVDIDTEIAWESIGLVLPNTHPILVPDVPPGLYRIADRVFANGETIDGFVMVEVVVESEPDPDETVVVTSIPGEGASSTTSVDSEGSEASVRWQLRGLGMSSAYVTSSGRIVLTSGDRVFVANGFSADRRVTSIAAETGEIVWQREFLAEDTFLQGVTDELLVINGQRDLVVAVSADTGEMVWTFDLPDLYGAVASVVDGDQIVVAADAQMEGDTRPPMVFALALADGETRWVAELAEGTDLQWTPLTVADSLVLVASTPSHPGSGGNTVHAVDTANGEIRWERDLGGTQGFHAYPIVTVDSVVMLWAPGETDELVGLDLDTGTDLWRAGRIRPLVSTADGRLFGVSGSIVVVDPLTGESVELIPDVEDSLSGVTNATVRDGQLVAVGRLWVRGYEVATGSLLWTFTPEQPLVDLGAFGESTVVIPTSEPAVVSIKVP